MSAPTAGPGADGAPGWRPVVVTGIGVICAAGRDPGEFWDRLCSGRSAITEVTDPAFRVFDARFAGQVPDEWLDEALDEDERGLDRFARLALVAARQAAGQAGLAAAGVLPERLGVVLGKCQSTPSGLDAAGRPAGYQPMHRTADVIGERLGLHGPRILLSTACAAGGNVVGAARDKILTGEADMVLAGGADPLLFGTYAGFGGMHALSDEPCAPYSRSDGLNLGEGAAFLVLEPLDLALARGATPLAEVAGYGLSADAYHATAPDPTGRGGASAMRRALAEAGLRLEDVDYVSGHGTGTPANDSMERKVMRAVFAGRAGDVPTSSIKSFIGHTLGAAGAIEAVASVLAIGHDIAPPTVNVAEPDATGGLDIVANTARAMPIDVVLSNNYAFGGNNVSLALTTPRPAREWTPLPTTDVVLTGIGPVGGLGVGVEQWLAALLEGRSGIAVDDAGRQAAAVPSLDGRTFAPRSLWRHMNGLSRWAIAASRLAWEDAKLTLPRAALDEVGLIYATAAGSAESVDGFDESVASDPNRPAVLSFANVVLNATGGAVCQTLGLRGPTTTICHGGASASLAVAAAVETIRMGKAQVVLVVAADEHGAGQRAAHAARGHEAADGAVRPYDRDRTGTVLGSGAVTLVLESAEHCAQRGAEPYATVVAAGHAARGAGEDEQDLTGRALAALLPADRPVDLVVGAADGGPHDGAEAAALHAALAGAHAGARVTAPAALLGSAGAVSGAAAIAVAALALRAGVTPEVAGLADPEHGPAERYAGTAGAGPRTALALTAAPGSVRGGVLLGGAW